MIDHSLKIEQWFITTLVGFHVLSLCLLMNVSLHFVCEDTLISLCVIGFFTESQLSVSSVQLGQRDWYISFRGFVKVFVHWSWMTNWACCYHALQYLTSPFLIDDTWDHHGNSARFMTLHLAVETSKWRQGSKPLNWDAPPSITPCHVAMALSIPLKVGLVSLGFTLSQICL